MSDLTVALGRAWLARRLLFLSVATLGRWATYSLSGNVLTRDRHSHTEPTFGFWSIDLVLHHTHEVIAFREVPNTAMDGLSWAGVLIARFYRHYLACMGRVAELRPPKPFTSDNDDFVPVPWAPSRMDPPAPRPPPSLRRLYDGKRHG